MADKKLKITLLKSTIGFNKKQSEVVTGLGLRKILDGSAELDYFAGEETLEGVKEELDQKEEQ